MLHHVATAIGYGFVIAGGVFLLALVFGIGCFIVDHFGNKFWQKLLALYDLKTLRHYLRYLESQGKTLRKHEDSSHDH